MFLPSVIFDRLPSDSLDARLIVYPRSIKDLVLPTLAIFWKIFHLDKLLTTPQSILLSLTSCNIHGVISRNFSINARYGNREQYNDINQ